MYLFVIAAAILLPLFRNHNPLATSIYNFISVANKDYYGVVLSALAILITFLIFNSQNEKEKIYVLRMSKEGIIVKKKSISKIEKSVLLQYAPIL
ncbi:hypothetical protein ANG4_1420 [Streptococcus anginosus 1505]|nr:hypothetical protein ANG4_1420 [Streptococcus anginosus 1505]